MLSARLCQDFRTDLGDFNVAFVPGIPDHHIAPIMSPGHCEKVEAAIFEDLHPVVFDGDLHIGTARPISQIAFRVAVSHDHYVKGLSGPEVADGHSVQGHTSGGTAGHRLSARLYQALKILAQQEFGLVMLLCRGFWHSNEPHDRTHWSRFIASTVHDFAHIQYEILDGLFEFWLFWHVW